MKSLASGPTKIVPVKMPETEKAAAIAACLEGEKLSAFIREATRREVQRRNRKTSNIKSNKGL